MVAEPWSPQQYDGWHCSLTLVPGPQLSAVPPRGVLVETPHGGRERLQGSRKVRAQIQAEELPSWGPASGHKPASQVGEAAEGLGTLTSGPRDSGRWLPLQPQPSHPSSGAQVENTGGLRAGECSVQGMWCGFFFFYVLKSNLLCWTLMTVNNCVHQIFIECLLCATHLGAGDRNVNMMVRNVSPSSSLLSSRGRKTRAG